MDSQVNSVNRKAWVPPVSLLRGIEAAIRLFDRYYILCMIPVSALILVMNYHAQGMQGVVPNYEDFKRIILAGFDPNAGIHGTPTFPMWGYGWLLLVTEDKTALLLFQNALALWAVWTFFRAVERNSFLPSPAVTLLKFLLAVSLPWYAFHSLRWPYSVAMSLFLVSFVMFVETISSEVLHMKRLLLSGVLFGLVLNFRSDYIWMPLMFVAIMLAVKGWKRRILGKGTLWLAAAYVLLLPWALYTKRATGHYLLTSTNAGHVLFIGLGNLPGNKWGIMPDDGDPVMHGLIRERLGVKKSSLLYDTDRLLKSEFLRRVLHDPREYLRKVFFASRAMLVGGAYTGEFFERPQCRPICFVEYVRMRGELKSNPVGFFLTSGTQGIHVAMQVFSGLVGRWVVFLSFAWLPLVAVLSWRQRDPLLILVLGGILYQAALNLLAYNMVSYTSNMYFFHLMNLSVGISWLVHFTWSQRGATGE